LASSPKKSIYRKKTLSALKALQRIIFSQDKKTKSRNLTRFFFFPEEAGQQFIKIGVAGMLCLIFSSFCVSRKRNLGQIFYLFTRSNNGKETASTPNPWRGYLRKL